MSTQKSKGAYYTSPEMVRFLKNRIEEIFATQKSLTILEPSAGEGAFIKEIVEHPCFSKKWHIDAVDIDPQALSLLQKNYPQVQCYNEDFIDYSSNCIRQYDLIIGNPPYIKKNLYINGQNGKITKYLQKNNCDFKGITNLWAFFVIASTRLLNDSGVLAFVIPTEFLTVKYAESIRSHLLKLFSSIEFITFEDLMFDTCKGQDTMVLVCRKQSVKHGVFFTTIPNASFQNVVSFQQLQRVEESKWSHYSLSAEEIDYLHRISQDCFPLSKYLSSAPGVVTAANSFFIVDDNTIQEYDLHDYARPIVQRATGLLQKFSLTKKEFNSLRRSGQPTNLLDFSKKSIPILSKAQKYLEQGELKQLDQRYKMLKRDKWYIIPNIPKPAEAFFFKRCHLLPKFMKNDAHILTTDAAYGIHMKTEFSINSLLFSFFNSLTLTWAELNGRFYGGGVLELTPSEFKSLPIYITNFEEGKYSFFSFNIQSKEEINDFLETQDQMILSKLGLSSEDQEKIRNIREKLQKKRLRY